MQKEEQWHPGRVTRIRILVIVVNFSEILIRGKEITHMIANFQILSHSSESSISGSLMVLIIRVTFWRSYSEILT